MTEPVQSERCARCQQPASAANTTRLVIARLLALAVLLGAGYGLSAPMRQWIDQEALALASLFSILAILCIATFRLCLRGRCGQCGAACR